MLSNLIKINFIFKLLIDIGHFSWLLNFFFIFKINATITILKTIITILSFLKKFVTTLLSKSNTTCSKLLAISNSCLSQILKIKTSFIGWVTFHFVEILIFLFIFLFIIDRLFHIYELYSQGYSNYYLNILPQGESSDSVPMDPPRWWPSGVPQGWAIVGTALATFGVLSRMPGVSPRGRVIGALASGGVSATQITYNSAIENSLGFNRLMWGLSEYRRTGVWPSLEHISKTTTNKQITDFANEAMKHSDQSRVDVVVKEVSDSANKFLPSPNLDLSDFIEKFSNLIFKETMQVLKPVEIQGFFSVGRLNWSKNVYWDYSFYYVYLYNSIIYNIYF
uniref:Uncharacterized protein n=1 Tax=Termitomyces sp. TaxID=1916073 RepID=A0A386TYE4_9AGAR|nr:hypothetical protein C0995_000067 [Termitomyces sp.]AYE93254.1 hypothetical protein C0995_000066 [Termitomyces sp.]